MGLINTGPSWLSELGNLGAYFLGVSFKHCGSTLWSSASHCREKLRIMAAYPFCGTVSYKWPEGVLAFPTSGGYFLSTQCVGIAHLVPGFLSLETALSLYNQSVGGGKFRIVLCYHIGVFHSGGISMFKMWEVIFSLLLISSSLC